MKNSIYYGVQFINRLFIIVLIFVKLFITIYEVSIANIIHDLLIWSSNIYETRIVNMIHWYYLRYIDLILNALACNLLARYTLRQKLFSNTYYLKTDYLTLRGSLTSPAKPFIQSWQTVNGVTLSWQERYGQTHNGIRHLTWFNSSS